MTTILCVICGEWFEIAADRAVLPHVGICGAQGCLIEYAARAVYAEKISLAREAVMLGDMAWLEVD